MQYNQLGNTNEKVSNICLGSMTWGLQNSQQDADKQIEFALSKGINFIDTAEMYPVPPSGDRYGHTEAIIGNWLARNSKKRSELLLATKIAGPGLSYVRNGQKVNGEAIIQSVDDSLKRLQTDYIDLYQIHWPNRVSPHFAKHKPNDVKITKADAKQESAQMLEILHALQDCIDAGKIKHCGLSDETTWGINTYLRLSEAHCLPRMVSIQNEFSLLHTKDWPYLIENCHHEQVAYLPWSPLAGGMLSGKYLNGARPEGSRWTFEQRNGIFRNTPQANEAVAAYVELSKSFDITPSQLALAWCKQIEGVTSTIIGATNMPQLEENIDAFDIQLTDEQMQQITQIWRQFPVPF